jgi:cytochrome c peroxidase
MKNVITSGRAYLFAAGLAFLGFAGVRAGELGSSKLDQELHNSLARQGFTGRVESTLAQRLGRPVDPAKAELGGFLFFDKFVGLHGDNSCAGCHSPLNGFGDSQSMAIGVENNNLVGPRRAGPAEPPAVLPCRPSNRRPQRDNKHLGPEDGPGVPCVGPSR